MKPRCIVPLLLFLAVSAGGAGETPQDGPPPTWAAAEMAMLGQAETTRDLVLMQEADLPALAATVMRQAGDGIASRPGRVWVAGVVLPARDQTADPIEHLACLPGGKQHETLVRVPLESLRRLSFVLEGAFGNAIGAPPVARAGCWLPPRGLPVAITARWRHPDRRGMLVVMPASAMFRDRETRRILNHPFVYAASPPAGEGGSRADGSDPDFRARRVRGSGATIASLFHDADALLWSSRPSAFLDDVVVLDRDVAPVTGQTVLLEFRLAAVDLLLRPAGGGWHIGETAVPDDGIVTRLRSLAHHPQGEAPRPLVVGIAVPDDDRGRDGAWMTTVLDLGRQARVHVAPVLIPSATVPLAAMGDRRPLTRGRGNDGPPPGGSGTDGF